MAARYPSLQCMLLHSDFHFGKGLRFLGAALGAGDQAPQWGERGCQVSALSITVSLTSLPGLQTACRLFSHWSLGFETCPHPIRLLPMALAPASCFYSNLHRDQRQKEHHTGVRRSGC